MPGMHRIASFSHGVEPGGSRVPVRAGAALSSWAGICSEDSRVPASVAAPVHQTVASHLCKSHATRPAACPCLAAAPETLLEDAPKRLMELHACHALLQAHAPTGIGTTSPGVDTGGRRGEVSGLTSILLSK